MSKEIWKDIPQYEGLYQVSNWGRVKALPKTRTNFYCGRSHTIVYQHFQERILKPTLAGHGYLSIQLTKDGKTTRRNVHRLVALAFIPKIAGCDCINHIDEDKTNNRVENLEWCSYRYNNSYGKRNEIIANKNRERRGRAIDCFTLDGKFLKSFETMAEGAKFVNNYSSAISACCRNKRKQVGGYIWKYRIKTGK